MKKRVYLLLLIPISFLILFVAKRSSFFAEKVFALRIYKVLSIGISSVTSLLPFSLAEMILIVAPFLLLFWIIHFIRKLIRKKGTRAAYIGVTLLNIACFASVVFFFYVCLCGVNYHRYTFTHYSGLTIQKSTEDELYALCLDLADRANDLRAKIPEVDAHGVMKRTESKREMAKNAEKAMQSLYKEYPVLSGYYAVPKGLLLSKLMSATETTGIYIPWTVEANVNVDIPDYTIPVTMCHELTHLRGFMREDEANYIAYLACTTYDNIEFQYSGVMLALVHAGNQLYDQDPTRYMSLLETYSEGVMRDFDANSEYWKKYENTVVSTVSNKVNDSYLKANSQEDGSKSYGRMVDLLLAEYRKKNTLS